MSDLSRRDFLKLLGAGALALVLPRRVRLAPQARRYRVVQRIAPQDGVLMTVDDGYSRTFAPMVEVFHRRRVPIAFFAVGRILPTLADYHGENLLEKLVEAGGIICNHSYSHPYFTDLDEKAIAAEIENWEAALANALGRDYLREMKARFPYFRIPFGAGKNLGRVLRVLEDYGYVVVWWNWDDMGVVLKFVDEAHLKDALQEPLFDEVTQAIVREATAVRPGDIVLMHSNDWARVSLEGVIDVLERRWAWADPVASLARAAGLDAGQSGSEDVAPTDISPPAPWRQRPGGRLPRPY